MANNILLAADDFASGSLAAGWSAIFGGSVCQVAGSGPHFTEPGAIGATVYGQLWTGLTWPSDQASEVTVQALTASGNNFLQLRVRYSSAADSGYLADITNDTALIYVVTAGTAVQLGSTVTGLTFAAGDVWTFQAAGSCLSLYQNGNRVAFVGDTTYTSGSPGYCQVAITVLTQNEIASWRGYNAIQQDGIWQKQGVVFAPNSADLSGSGVGIYEGTCIYDTNPQLISANPDGKVFKFWFSSGSFSAASTYYAESPNLKPGTWTRYGSAVIANFTTPKVIKVGSTYYLYCQAGNAQGTGPTAFYTSAASDGLNWAQQSTNVLAVGSAGAWDSLNIYPLRPIAVINGTWYALYGGAKTAGQYKVGLVTSTDGAGAVWTKYTSNPVLPNGSVPPTVFPYACFAQVGSTFWVWMQRGAPSVQNTATDNDPTGIVRYSTVDFKNWSPPVAGMHHAQMFESLNTPVNNTEAVGGLAPYAIFDIAGKANMFYGMSQGDGVGPYVAQAGLAIAPAPIASVVQFKENALQQTASDNFAYGAGPLSANWTKLAAFPTIKVVAGPYAEPSALTDCLAAYTGISFSASHYSEVTVQAAGTAGNTALVSPAVCMNPSTSAFYYVGLGSLVAGTQQFKASILGYNGTVGWTLSPNVGITVNIGDVLRLTVTFVNSVPVLSFYQNGSLISQAVDVTSTALSGGAPGMYMNEGAAGKAQVSLWAGGNANVIPIYPPIVTPGTGTPNIFGTGGTRIVGGPEIGTGVN